MRRMTANEVITILLYIPIDGATQCLPINTIRFSFQPNSIVILLHVGPIFWVSFNTHRQPVCSFFCLFYVDIYKARRIQWFNVHSKLIFFRLILYLLNGITFRYTLLVWSKMQNINSTFKNCTQVILCFGRNWTFNRIWGVQTLDQRMMQNSLG